MGRPGRKRILPAPVDRSKNKTRLVPFAAQALCLAGLLVLTSCRPFFQREVSSAVLASEGPADATFAGKTKRLTPNEWVLPGTKIATGRDGRLDLMLLPGILVAMDGETEIEITRLRFARDGDETIRPMRAREASIRLRRGTLFVAIGQSQTRSRIFIETAAGNLTAFDLRTFKIEAGENRTRVMSVRGKINFKHAGDGSPVNFGAGYFAEWPASEPTPRAAAESDSKTQAEVPQILRIEKRLFRLQKNFGFGFTPWRQ